MEIVSVSPNHGSDQPKHGHVRNVLNRLACIRVTASPVLLLSSIRSLVSELLSEIRRWHQRNAYERRTFAPPARISLAVNCPSCKAQGERFCYTSVSNCTRHIEDLQRRYPWIGWAEISLIVETWRAANDMPSCSCDSAKTQQTVVAQGSSFLTEEKAR
jgi:hypothetical protein